MKTEILVNFVVQSRLGGKVQRCHGIPHNGSYSVAEHSWGVAMLLWYIFPEHFTRLVPYALSHDVPEAWVGDVPAPTMRYVPGLREALSGLEGMLNHRIGLPAENELSGEEHAVLKACDRLELYLWAMEQTLMGNQFAYGCMEELERYAKESPFPGKAFLFFEKLRTVSVLPKQAGVIKETIEHVYSAPVAEGQWPHEDPDRHALAGREVDQPPLAVDPQG